MNDIDYERAPAPAAAGGPARAERTFVRLVNLLRTRAQRRVRLRSRQRNRPTRSKAFEQVQRRRWLGIKAAAPRARAEPPIKDLHKRILLDPHAPWNGPSDARTGR